MANVLHCELSPWRGDGEMCRWCNVAPHRGGRSYCSRECASAYYDNHTYTRGRAVVWEMSRGDCACPDPMTPQLGYINMDTMRVEYLSFAKPHGLCAACGRCEEQLKRAGDKLTCNHIDPRMGLPMGLSHCIHHMDNLEMLCWRDHELLNKLGNQRDKLPAAILKEFGSA